MNSTLSPIRLTQYSHGAGCGCKISPEVLSGILKKEGQSPYFPSLLVGNEERDDAAVVDLGDGTAIISTTDFFMPIVDDPKDFGRIASVNAISDVYAMGGQPILAIAILGWPIDKLSSEVANEVIEGARDICSQVNIPLAGGHSIDSPEPIFGLAVTGRVDIKNLKKNGGAKVGDLLFLTKPLGVGILSTAEKKGKLRIKDETLARNNMLKINILGEVFGKMEGVNAMTDVTGFGLLGHLIEMCEASNTSAEIDFDKVPLLNEAALDFYLTENCIPGGTKRNFASYGHKISPLSERQKWIGCDPQTSGGLLTAVAPHAIVEFLGVCKNKGIEVEAFGAMKEKRESLVYLKN